jgi:hypothetical protein
LNEILKITGKESRALPVNTESYRQQQTQQTTATTER